MKRKEKEEQSVPQTSPDPICTRADVWTHLLGRLGASVGGADHQDDVQDTCVSLFETLGPAPARAEAEAMSGLIKCRRGTDRRRRASRQPRLIDDVEQVADKKPEEPARLQLPPDVRRLLGKRGIELVEAMCAGVWSNKALARLLGTKPAAIRKRKERLRPIIERWVREGILGRMFPPRTITG